MLRIFGRRWGRRHEAPAPTIVPQTRSPIAHLCGPGKLGMRKGRIVYRQHGQRLVELDGEALEHLLLYGRISLSPAAVAGLMRCGVHVAWLTRQGHRMLGQFVRPHLRSLLLLQQYRLVSDEKSRRKLAHQIVRARLESQLGAVRHYEHNHYGVARPVRDRIDELHRSLGKGPAAGTGLDELRGIEGAATAAWFALLRQLLRKPWTFPARKRRPPTDPVNALLSLAATLLTQRAAARCEALGWDVGLGFLHAFRSGRPALACDLAEPLRAVAVERWVLATCNQGQVKPEQFHSDPERFAGVRLTDEAFGRVLALWEQHWQSNQCDTILDQWLLAWRNRARELAGPWKRLLRDAEQGRYIPVTPQSPTPPARGQDGRV